MENNINHVITPIQKLLNISLILQLSYFGLALLVNFLQQKFVTLFRYMNVDRIFINWSGIIGIIVTAVMFIVLYTLFSNRLKSGKICTSGFSILIIVGAFVMIYVIPSITALIYNFITSSMLNNHEITAETFAASIAISRVISLLNILYLTSIIMLLCAYAMFWFRSSYLPAQQNDCQ